MPPAFPAVRIDGELYWDGGILSNTPTEVIFDDNPRRNSLIFAVHMWNPVGPEPETMWEVTHRQKDIQYSSRVASHIARQMQTHRLRHVIKELLGHIPEDVRNSEAVRELAGWGCLTRMHVVRLLAPRLDNEDHTKDVDFSPSGIRQRWEAGYANTQRAIEQAPWQGEFDPLEGVILHEPRADTKIVQVDGNLNPVRSEADRSRRLDSELTSTGERPSCERAEEAPCPSTTPSSSAPARPARRWRTAWRAPAMRVAIVERHRFGGTCVNTGCTPTKTLVASAYAAHLARRAGEFGVTIAGPVTVDMKKVKARKDYVLGFSNRGVERSLQKQSHDHRLPGPRALRCRRTSVAVGGETLSAPKIFINVGGRAFVPDIPGLDQVDVFHQQHDAGRRFRPAASDRRRRQLHRPRVRADLPPLRQRGDGRSRWRRG